MEEPLSESQLQHLLKQAAPNAVVGAQYMHYKQKLYTVTGLAIIEATNEIGVIYRADYGAGLSFIRPLGSWMATVQVRDALMPRFKRVAAD